VEESCSRSEEALDLTNCVEARAYTSCAAAIRAYRKGDSSSAANHVREVERLEIWDALISTFRACPEVLKATTNSSQLNAHLVAALRRSQDFDLAKEAGIDLGRRPRASRQSVGLSRREKEVLDLVQQGLTNGDIAQALFISKSTVKVHIRHILR